jgi:hypothetical protein
MPGSPLLSAGWESNVTQTALLFRGCFAVNGRSVFVNELRSVITAIPNVFSLAEEWLGLQFNLWLYLAVVRLIAIASLVVCVGCVCKQICNDNRIYLNSSLSGERVSCITQLLSYPWKADTDPLGHFLMLLAYYSRLFVLKIGFPSSNLMYWE